MSAIDEMDSSWISCSILRHLQVLSDIKYLHNRSKNFVVTREYQVCENNLKRTIQVTLWLNFPWKHASRWGNRTLVKFWMHSGVNQFQSFQDKTNTEHLASIADVPDVDSNSNYIESVNVTNLSISMYLRCLFRATVLASNISHESTTYDEPHYNLLGWQRRRSPWCT